MKTSAVIFAVIIFCSIPYSFAIDEKTEPSLYSSTVYRTVDKEKDRLEESIHFDIEPILEIRSSTAKTGQQQEVSSSVSKCITEEETQIVPALIVLGKLDEAAKSLTTRCGSLMNIVIKTGSYNDVLKAQVGLTYDLLNPKNILVLNKSIEKIQALDSLNKCQDLESVKNEILYAYYAVVNKQYHPIALKKIEDYRRHTSQDCNSVLNRIFDSFDFQKLAGHFQYRDGLRKTFEYMDSRKHKCVSGKSGIQFEQEVKSFIKNQI